MVGHMALMNILQKFIFSQVGEKIVKNSPPTFTFMALKEY